MSDWRLSYTGYDPDAEGLRETLCALGNGYIVSRGAAPDALSGDTHYRGTYLAGGYDRLTSRIAGHDVENEDLVNLPDWLPLAIRIADGDWLRPERVHHLDYRQELDLRAGLLCRTLRFGDGAGRVTRWEERRFVSMHDPHFAVLSLRLVPENWSGRLTLRSAIDGSVTNDGVPRYRALESRHLETLDTVETEGGLLALRARFVQARREVALAARTDVTVAGGHVAPARTERLADLAAQEFEIDAHEGRPVSVEKIACYFDSKDHAIAEPLQAAIAHARDARHAGALEAEHRGAWAALWDRFDIRIESRSDAAAQLRLRLHIFHLLQTASTHSVDRDVGVPPRGWHGEAYRGHIMWDELFIFPYLTLRMPVVTRSLLLYRYRRLDEARRAAREAGHAGAMYPWQSGSDGREESQRIHLNPRSGNWIPDNSWRQRHIGAAVAYNIWRYFQATDDRDFLRDYGAEMFVEIARFWAGMAEPRADGRYGIRGVMGPDEFHTAYPGADPSTEGGLDNNAYTNVMVSWLLERARDVLELLPEDDRRAICDRLGIGAEEPDAWEEIGCNLFVPFHADGILSQFEGYEDLAELDWEGLRARHGDLQRLDRILEAEDDDPNRYKASKQADALMLFYLFSREEIERIFDRLGYAFGAAQIFPTIRYYMQRTSHGSTLSFIAHAWVLARADRQRSWQLALTALDADVSDIQGGTTREGIHLGAMAGTVDLLQRCYTGLELRAGMLSLNPRLPDEVAALEATIRYRAHILDIRVTQDRLTVASRMVTAPPIAVAYRGQSREIAPGQTIHFRLIPEIKPDRPERERELERVREVCGDDRA
jgi:alpha,alpha-trehalase